MKKLINIYKLNPDKLDDDFENDLIEEIVSIVNTGFKKKKLERSISNADIVTSEIDGVSYFNYVDNSHETESDWKDFLPGKLLGSFTFRDRISTVLLFIYNPPHIYVTIGGNGYSFIKDFIDHTFGLQLISKIADNLKDEIISINSRGMIGATAAIQEQFARSLKIIDYVKFGKIPLDVNLKLNKDTTSLYFSYLLTGNQTRLKVKAGRYFTIRKSLDYSDLHEVILNLNYIMELEEQDSFTTFQRIKDYKHIVDELLPFLFLRLFQSVRASSGSVTSVELLDKLDFYLCHPTLVREFFEAEEYKIEDRFGNDKFKMINSTSDRSNIFTIIQNKIIQIGYSLDQFEFNKYIRNVRITALTDGVIKSQGSFIKHISTELKLPGKSSSVFYLDSRWYRLNNTYREQISNDCWQLYLGNKIPSIHQIKKWDFGEFRTEGLYNLSYSNEIDFLVLDTITPDAIELCDILKVTDDNIYLFHVKRGFDSKMRDLSNQVILSSRVLTDTINTEGKEYLKILHKKYLKKNYIHPNYKDEDSLIKLFDGSRQINQVMTIALGLDVSKSDIEEIAIKNSGSSIAKFAIMNCSRQMKAYDFNFHICLI